MKWFEKPYHFRYPYVIIRLAVVLFLFTSSRNARAIIYYVFRAKVSHKTICEWVQKFPIELPTKYFSYEKNSPLFLFVDEKYVWIKGEQGYWWTVRDQFGNVLDIKRSTGSLYINYKPSQHLQRYESQHGVTAEQVR
jgi:transposase-like protein